MAGERGDDLEDDYIPDELIATSGDEEEYSYHGSSNGDLSPDDDALKPSGSATQVGNEKNNKRKRNGKDKQRKPKVGCLNQTVFYPKIKTKVQKPKLREMQDESGLPIARQSPSELAEHLACSQSKSFSRLSRVELENIRIPGGCGLQRALLKFP
jgi:protein CMS1